VVFSLARSSSEGEGTLRNWHCTFLNAPSDTGGGTSPTTHATQETKTVELLGGKRNECCVVENKNNEDFDYDDTNSNSNSKSILLLNLLFFFFLVGLSRCREKRQRQGDKERQPFTSRS
jgi:hypothetical protein